jgi:hypothetical protein
MTQVWEVKHGVSGAIGVFRRRFVPGDIVIRDRGSGFRGQPPRPRLGLPATQCGIRTAQSYLVLVLEFGCGCGRGCGCGLGRGLWCDRCVPTEICAGRLRHQLSGVSR